MSRKAAQIPPVPHSWPVSNWPAEVWPNDTAKAHWMVRVHRNELVKMGALARAGRELIILGARYEKWLQRRVAEVLPYQSTANVAKRAKQQQSAAA